MFQMKEQDKTPEKTTKWSEDTQLSRKRIQNNNSKDDSGSWRKKVRMEMEVRIKKMQEMFNKDLEELKNKQTEMNNTITEMKNTLEGINSRITEAEERISDLERQNGGIHCCGTD